MNDKENQQDREKKDIIDDDLYEEFDDEELYEIVQEAKKEALARAAARKKENKTYRKFPRIFYWLIALFMIMNVIAFLPNTISIPVIDFLKTSAQLSTKEDIKEYKQSVVTIETDSGRGTGFSMNNNGDIVTNYHVIEGYNKVTVAFPKKGLYVGEVVESYPEIDLAILHLEDNEENFPFLEIANSFELVEDEHIYFIGNPLNFNGIANEGTILNYTQVKSKPAPVVMMDAPVYRGNSGSPVINKNGEVIGVVYATLDHEKEGRVGLFIPIQLLHEYRQS